MSKISIVFRLQLLQFYSVHNFLIRLPWQPSYTIVPLPNICPCVFQIIIRRNSDKRNVRDNKYIKTSTNYFFKPYFSFSLSLPLSHTHTHTHTHTFTYVSIVKLKTVLMVSFFELEKGSKTGMCSPVARETWVQSQVESYQRLKIIVLDASLLNTHHYKLQIKGKVWQFREKSSTLPNTLV